MTSTEVASAPEGFEVTSMDRNSVTLRWKRPKQDGGALVTGYVLEQRDGKAASWNNVKVLDSHSHFYQIRNLIADYTYSFRIRAKNSVGLSEPAEIETTLAASKKLGE